MPIGNPPAVAGAVKGDLSSDNLKRGKGSPNGTVIGKIGDTYINTSGGAGTTLYVKESGDGTNTGWVGK